MFLLTTYNLSLTTLFLAGCATAPPLRPSVSAFLPAHRVTIEQGAYLPSAAVAQELKGQGRWDPETQVWILTAGRHELRVAPEMPVALVDGSPQTISPAPRMREGEILLPEILWTRWLAAWPAPKVPSAPPSAPPLALRTVIIDAGHGGHDPGATGRGGLREKSVTLDIALRLRDLLEQDGFRVVMTRDRDRFLPLSRRAEIANQEGGDLFVSIHANASRRRSISGFEVYTLSEATDDHARALEAAENSSLPDGVGESASPEIDAIVWDLLYTEHRAESVDLAASICRGMRESGVSSQNRGIKTARFAVLKGTRMPAILVEVGFVTHPAEEGRLRNAGYRQRLAEGIHKGIRAFKRKNA